MPAVLPFEFYQPPLRIKQAASQNTKGTGHKLYLFCYLCNSKKRTVILATYLCLFPTVLRMFYLTATTFRREKYSVPGKRDSG